MTLDDKLRSWRESTEGLVPPERVLSALREAAKVGTEPAPGPGGVAAGTIVLASVVATCVVVSAVLVFSRWEDSSAAREVSASTAPPISEQRTAPDPQTGVRRAGTSTASVTGARFRVWTRGDPTRVRGLRLRGRVVCVEADGHRRLGEERHIDLTTDERGDFVIAETGECLVSLSIDEPTLALGQADGDGVELLATKRTVVVLVSDAAGRPVGGAVIEGQTHLGSNAESDTSPAEFRDIGLFVIDEKAFRCVANQDGRCELAVHEAHALSFSVAAPGWATASVRASETDNEVRVTLEPERVLTVTVEAPAPSLAAVLELRVESQHSPVLNRSAEQNRTIDAPGSFRIVGLSADSLRVSLRESGRERPFAEAIVPAGSDDSTVSLSAVPRWLDIWVDPAPAGHHRRLADIRCPNALRLLAELVPVGETAQARIEYVPMGPCVVSLAASDTGWAANLAYEPVTVSPPGRVKLVPSTRPTRDP